MVFVVSKIGFVFSEPEWAVYFHNPFLYFIYVHLAFSEIGFVLHKKG
jgi:hypothetical protein